MHNLGSTPNLEENMALFCRKLLISTPTLKETSVSIRALTIILLELKLTSSMVPGLVTIFVIRVDGPNALDKQVEN